MKKSDQKKTLPVKWRISPNCGMKEFSTIKMSANKWRMNSQNTTKLSWKSTNNIWKITFPVNQKTPQN